MQTESDTDTLSDNKGRLEQSRANSRTLTNEKTEKQQLYKTPNKQNMRWNEQKTSINFICLDMCPPTALTSVRSFTMFAMSCSSESIGRRLGMSMNSRSDWLKSGAKHYRHCYQWTQKASTCSCPQKGPIFRIFTVSIWTTGQLDKLSARVTESEI